MAAKPMPRLRAGISGTPILSSAKRSLGLHVKPKSEGRCPPRHAVGVSGTSTKKEQSLPDQRVDDSAEERGSSSNTKQLPFQSDEEVHCAPQSTWDKVCSQLDFSEKSPGFEQLRVNLEDSTTEPPNATPGSEESRLKQLMLLQISLIGRQQDLLKLRDKEIMQLKQKTQSYKSRLERMERRIQLSRRQFVDTPMNFRKSSKSVEEDSESDAIPKESDLNLESSVSESIEGTSSSRKATISSGSTSQQIQDISGFDKHASPINIDSYAAPAPSMLFTSPVSLVHSAYAASGCIPVPASYVDRCRDQLAPFAVEHAASQPVVIKVCEHCAQCAAIVDEIKRELPGSEEEGMTKVLVTEQTIKPISTSSHPDTSDDVDTEEVPMQTHHPYHLITWPRDDQSYRFTDLDFNLEEGSSLNIPTWKLNKLTPLSSSTIPPESKEIIDDDAFLKRHSRLEVAEKRRKRWDIQRIREFRYNEKLRQRKLKQSGDSCFETFAPSISDITAVQIEENLPVNVFGHLLQPLQFQEFSLETPL